MTFNDKKKEHIDNEAFRIIELLEETIEEIDEPNYENGSIAHQIADDWSDKLADLPYLITSTHLETTVSKKECYKGKCIGLNENSYREFQKLVSVIHKDSNVNSIIGREFIENKSFEWLLKTFKDKKAENNFSSFILDEMQSSVEIFKVHFSILYLTIGHPIQVGNVKFEFFTKEYFDSLTLDFRTKNPEKKENPNDLMRKRYQGNVYATYIVKAEREKAKEIAFEHCSLAVDVLKMCSETTDFPEVKLSFDIDSRTKENTRSEVLLTNPNNIVQPFTIDSNRLPSQHKISINEWKGMLQRQIGDFHNFLLTLPIDISELEQLIINGIKRYGNSISNTNLHQRIVELFTILESLLLLDKNSPIIESVCKYCSKIVFKEPSDRKQLISLLKTMYETRSALIHHAKEISFESENLRKLQYVVIMLLSKLIIKSKTHKTKQSLLQEIDDAILNAY